MELREIKKARVALEKKILQDIEDFEKATDISVSSIILHNSIPQPDVAPGRMRPPDPRTIKIEIKYD